MKPFTPPVPSPRPRDDADARELRDHVPTGSVAEQEAARWLLAQRGGLDAVGESKLRQWLAADAGHRAAWLRAQQLDHALAHLPADGVRRLKANLLGRRQGVRDRVDAGRRGWLGGAVRLLPQAGLAAAVVGAVGSGAWGIGWWRRQPVFSQSYTTQRGQQLAVTLPDSSTLQLDAATHVEVVLYRDRRVVRLREGQAVFSVQGDVARPFDVLADTLRITVVGTRFSVRNVAGDEDRGVAVAVEEGRVRVAWSPTADGLLLRAGQAYARGAPDGPGTVSNLARGGIAPWREGRVAFDDTPLAEALAEFARYGEVRLRIADPGVAELRVSGSFDVRKVDNFAKVIQRVLPVRLRPSDDGAVLLTLR